MVCDLELTDIANVTLHEVSESWQYEASLADTGLDAVCLIIDREINANDSLGIALDYGEWQECVERVYGAHGDV